MKQILVVEDLPEYQHWLVQVLATHWPNAKIHRASDIRSARHIITHRHVLLDLVILDLALPDGLGIELMPLILQAHPSVMMVVSTVFDDDGHLFSALTAGAQGYLLKDLDEEQFVRHLTSIEAGEPPISPAIARRLLAYFRGRPITPPEQAPLQDHSPLPHLTPRELEILRYIGRGLRVSETAKLLDLTENTVAGYVKSLYRKLNVSSRAEAAIEAARRGLI